MTLVILVVDFYSTIEGDEIRTTETLLANIFVYQSNYTRFSNGLYLANKMIQRKFIFHVS